MFFVYLITLLYCDFIKNILILFTFLKLKSCCISTKLELLKNIFIHFFNILVVCINFIY